MKIVKTRVLDSSSDWRSVYTIWNDAGIKRKVLFISEIKLKTGRVRELVEVYTGPEYVSGSKNKNSTKSYPSDEFPAKYKPIVAALKKSFNSTRWASVKGFK